MSKYLKRRIVLADASTRISGQNEMLTWLWTPGCRCVFPLELERDHITGVGLLYPISDYKQNTDCERQILNVQ